MKSSPKLPIAEKWVVNASPVIALGRVGQIEILTQLPQRVVMPQAVKEEILAAPAGDPARDAVERGLFDVIRNAPNSARNCRVGFGQRRNRGFILRPLRAGLDRHFR